uniref:CUB_2 domain-containing protein n=1 Tax=Caenorhabditis japonica TaxID=281687 RepID=A0A8R1HR81_CAEJA
MNFPHIVLLLSVLYSGCWALDCTQIPDWQIFDGDQFWYPYNTTKAVTIPPNFQCTYTIKAPITSSQILFANVGVTNLLRGPNDRLIITDSLGVKTVLGSLSSSWLEFEVFPGRPMTVQVITKSVNTNSQFLIHVQYNKVTVGPTQMLKTGGIMNFVDMSTIGGFRNNVPNSVSIQANEQMSVSMALAQTRWPVLYLSNCYIIDGDFLNQTQVRRLEDFANAVPFVSKTNKITFVSFQKDIYNDTAAVINPLSEVQQFSGITAEASTGGEKNNVVLAPLDSKIALEIVAVQEKKIIMDTLVFFAPIQPNCTAKIVTGPPNNYSQLLLDLTISENLMPYTFNLKYFSVIAENCEFAFTVTSPAPQK